MSSFKALMQQAQKNQNEYEKQQLNKINKQLEFDEKRKREENEKIKRKEEALNKFKKIAKTLPNDVQRSNEKSDIKHSLNKGTNNESSMNRKLQEKNTVFNTKIKKISNSNNINNNSNNDNNSKIKMEKKKNIGSSSSSQFKKHLSFKDLMEKAKHNDISKPVINNSSDDFREAKKALKNILGKKKYKNDFDDDSENEKYSSKSKNAKKKLHDKHEVKKSKKELLNEQMERKRKEKERNLKAYDGSKDRVAQERLNILKSRGIYNPVTSKISQEVTEMVKRMESNKNNKNSNTNNNNKSIGNNKTLIPKDLSRHQKPIRNNENSYDKHSDISSRKYSRYSDDESNDYNSEYERRRRQIEDKKKVKKIKGMFKDYEVYDEDYANNNYSSIIRSFFGYDRNRYKDEEDIDDMEVGYSDVKREEARSLRIAKREDEVEEELERQRLERLKKRKRT